MSIRSRHRKGPGHSFSLRRDFSAAATYFTYKLFRDPEEHVVKKAMAGPQPHHAAPTPSIAEYERCLKIKEGGNLVEARAAFEDFVSQNPDSPRINEARGCARGH